MKISASDVRRWKSTDQPKIEQNPARASANEADLKKGNRLGSLKMARRKYPAGHISFGRPVTAQDVERHSVWSGVSCVWGFFSRRVQAVASGAAGREPMQIACQPLDFPVV
jgi:hypothetical protein